MESLSNQSVYARLKKHSLNNLDKVVLIDKDGFLTNKEAFDIYCGIINELVDNGLKKGDICFVQGNKCKEIALVICALMSIGATIYIYDHKDTIAKAKENVSYAFKSDAAIYFDNDNNWIFEKNNQKNKLSLSKQSLKYEMSLIAKEGERSFIVMTSGSTDKKKAVLLSELGFINHVCRLISTFSLPNEISYHCAPLTHIFGIVALIPLYILGYTVFVSDTRNPEYALDIIEKYHCTKIENVPTFYYMLMEAQKNNPRDISSLKHGTIAGGGYSQEQFSNIEKALGMNLCSIYGMTEGSGLMSSSLPSDALADRSRGVGQFFPGVDVILRDKDGNIVKDKGEICFKGYNLMIGYLKNGTIECPVDEDGYFHTGDIGLIDEKNILHIIGRTKDIIIRGGENISPRQVEDQIYNLGNIKDVCVVGIPNEKYGEIVAALIVSDKYNEPKEIQNLLKNKLNKYEIPELIVFDKEIPLMENGKKDKKKIKEYLSNLVE